MKPVPAPPGKTCHLLVDGDLDAGGTILHKGGDVASPQPGDSIVWFDTLREREERPDVQAYSRQVVVVDLLFASEQAKREYAYILAHDEARRWLELHPTDDGAVPDAAAWPLLEIRVTECDCTAHEAATDIIAAVVRDVIEPERARIRAREKARAL